MAYGIKLRIWGEFALFTRPEMKVERVSYDVITPSAARGILEAIYWKPQMRWVVDRIHILAPIRFTQVRRNEIKSRIAEGSIRKAQRAGSGKLGLCVADDRQQRAALLLRDVHYGIEAHIDVIDGTEEGGRHLANPVAKHLDQFRRRASKGQYFHHPYMGCREFPADFELVEEFAAAPPDLSGQKDFGFMLHDIVFRPDAEGKIIESSRGQRVTAEPRFFRAEAQDGVIEVPPLETTRS